MGLKKIDERMAQENVSKASMDKVKQLRKMEEGAAGKVEILPSVRTGKVNEGYNK